MFFHLLIILSKNSLAIFSWAVAVGSKGHTWKVTEATWVVSAFMFAFEASVETFKGTVWAVSASMWDVLLLHGLPQPLCSLWEYYAPAPA